MIFGQKNGNFKQILVSNWVSVHLMEGSVSVSKFYSWKVSASISVSKFYNWKVSVLYRCPHTLNVLLGLKSAQMWNLVCWGQGEFLDTHTVKVFDKNEKGTLQHPRCLSIYWDQSQLKMSIPDYWGQGISIDTHIAKVCGKNEKGTLALPWCSQCPLDPK